MTDMDRNLIWTCTIGGVAVAASAVAIGIGVSNSRKIKGLNDKVNAVYTAAAPGTFLDPNAVIAADVSGLRPLAPAAQPVAPAPVAPAPVATAIDPATMQAIINQAVAAAMAQQQPQQPQQPVVASAPVLDPLAQNQP